MFFRRFLVPACLLGALLIGHNSSAVTLDKVVAIIQGKPILLSDVKKLHEQIEKSPLLRNFYHFQGLVNQTTVLNRLVEDQIIRARLKELNSEMTNDEVNRQIESIAKQNKITVTQLKSVLKNQGASFEAYFEAMKTNMERRTLYNRELQRAGSTMTDEELKALYKNKAPSEFQLAFLVEKATKENKKLLDAIAEKFRKGKIPPDKLKEYPNIIDLGWLPLDQVADSFKKFMSKAQAGNAFGPLKKDGKYQLLLVENARKGSDAQFEESKEKFRDNLDDEEIGKKFVVWLEKQKNQMEVTVNGI